MFSPSSSHCLPHGGAIHFLIPGKAPTCRENPIRHPAIGIMYNKVEPVK
jgi:hypothetical protein